VIIIEGEGHRKKHKTTSWEKKQKKRQKVKNRRGLMNPKKNESNWKKIAGKWEESEEDYGDDDDYSDDETKRGEYDYAGGDDREWRDIVELVRTGMVEVGECLKGVEEAVGILEGMIGEQGGDDVKAGMREQKQRLVDLAQLNGRIVEGWKDEERERLFMLIDKLNGLCI